MIRVFEPRFTPNKRKYFSHKRIPEIYVETKNRIKSLLNEIEYCSATCDGWSNPSMDAFYSLTVHFIDKNFKMISICLECAPFYESHTGVEISSWINETLNEWNLIDKIVCITTDNGTNMIKAIQLTNYRNVRCFAHSTNIGVNNIFKNEGINDLIVKAKHQRNLLSNSNKFKRLFNAQDFNSSDLTIPSDVTTRWWSTYNMLSRCLLLRENMNETLNNYENGKFRKYKLNESDVKIIKGINGLLSIVKDRIEYICGENYITASIIIPMIDTIYEQMNEYMNEFEKEITTPINEGDILDEELVIHEKLRELLNYGIASLKKAINERLVNGNTKSLLQLTTYLDPRFKSLYDNSEEIMNEIKCQLMNDLIDSPTNISMESTNNITTTNKTL